jgi:hypothetical protein
VTHTIRQQKLLYNSVSIMSHYQLLDWATRNASAINKATESEDAKGSSAPKEPLVLVKFSPYSS